MRQKIYDLLRKSERFFKTDMVYLAKGGFWLGIGQFVASFSAFLTSIAFANLLLPDTFGLYKYILSIVSLLAISTLTGMDSSVMQATARGYEGTLIPATLVKMKWGVLGSVLSLGIGTYYYSQGNMTLATAFGVVALFIPFAESLDMYNSFLFGKKLFGTQAIYGTWRKLFGLLLVIITLIITKNLYLIIASYFLAIVVPNIFLYYRTIRFHKSNNRVDRDAIGYGKHLSAIYIIGIILGELDKILVFHHVGAIDLAVYSFATAPTDQIKGLSKNINSLAMPQFSRKNPHDIQGALRNKVFVLGLSITLIVLAYIAIAPLFFKILFPQYVASIPYSQILALSLIPVVIAGFLYTILESQKATRQLYQYNLYSNIVNIIVLLPLVYFFGIWGAIISRFISRLFNCGLALILMKKIAG